MRLRCIENITAKMNDAVRLVLKLSLSIKFFFVLKYFITFHKICISVEEKKWERNREREGEMSKK